MKKTPTGAQYTAKKDSLSVRWKRARKSLWRCRYLYLLLFPTLLWYFIFCYSPLYGAQIAFKQFVPALGISGSKWVGFKYFKEFFSSVYFGRLMRNTLGISIYSIVVGFPVPIILAILLNEVNNKYFKKTVQTVIYMPHFISVVIVVSLLNAMLSPSNGLLNQVIVALGGESIYFMAQPQYFKTIYVLSDIWQTAGYSSIIYLSSLTSIDPCLYEAATVDGASRWQRIWHVTLPGILPTIMTMLILRMGNVFTVGYEKIMLMYNAATYETADVISTYVYRRAFQNGDYSFSTAVGLFNSVINFVVLIIFNKISKKVSEVSLW